MANETTLGGSRESFPESTWASALSPDCTPERRAELVRELCGLYWRPIYRYIRLSGKPIEDAKDLCQEFFCYLLEEDVLFRYDRERGRFRHFIKATLKNFLLNVHRTGRAQKRGGGKAALSLDVEALERTDWLADPNARNPEDLFDQQWADDVMERAMEELHRALKADGKELYFRLYEEYALRPPEERPTYEALAKTHALAVHDVRNHLKYVRDRLQALLMRRVSEYVSSHSELLEEMGDLFFRRQKDG